MSGSCSIDFVAHHVHDDFGHAAGLAISRALKDHVLHCAAAQMLDALLAENPGDRIGDVALAAAVWPDDGGNSVTCEENFGVVREGFEAGNFEAFQFEHRQSVDLMRGVTAEASIKGDLRGCTIKAGGRHVNQNLSFGSLSRGSQQVNNGCSRHQTSQRPPTRIADILSASGRSTLSLR